MSDDWLFAVAEPSMSEPIGLGTPLKGLVDGKTLNGLADGLDIHTVGRLLRHYPRRNQVRGELTPIAVLRGEVGEVVAVEARVVSATSFDQKKSTAWEPKPGKRKTVQRVVVTDGVEELSLVFFNQEFRMRRDFVPGSHAFFEGKVVERWFKEKRTIELVHPKILNTSEEILGGITPVYPAAGAIDTDAIRTAIRVVLDVLGPVEDPLPADLRLSHGFPGIAEAFRLIHRPDTEADATAAKHRFRFEEAYVLQTVLALRRAAARGMSAHPRVPAAGGLLDAFDARLPFTLTDGQREVGQVLLDELALEHPMQRLLQGEVGSGKTVVALRAMLAVVDAGGQAALLAPTEVLAQQHLRSITELLGPLAERGLLGGSDAGTRLALLTGSLGTAARRQALLDTVSGAAGIVIGTHALLEERVEFFDLGLVVVDEQHRFGVEQRAALAARATERDRRPPHVLVMTATPIPRTVAMTVFGDLETSTLTELPSGRAPIETHVVPLSQVKFVARVWQIIRDRVAAGQQAYVVCARIGATGVSDSDGSVPVDSDGPARPPAAAVLDVWPQLAAHELNGLRVEILHGQLPADTKDDVMRRFSAGDIDVLVATTVVEVGVDVPNASVMVVLDADRFGVSQLHQLRGRVGRGSEPSVCFLVTDLGGGPARERLDAVADTLDGFALSDVDLRQRREGDLLGAAQSGRRTSLRLLSVLDHGDVIAEARAAATTLVAADPELSEHPALREEVEVLTADVRTDYLDRS